MKPTKSLKTAFNTLCWTLGMGAFACSGVSTESTADQERQPNGGTTAQPGELDYELNTLLSSVALVEQDLAVATTPQVAEHQRQLLDLLGTAATTAADLSNTFDTDPEQSRERLEQLSTVAGQLPVVIKRIKQELRLSGIDEGSALLRGLDTMKLASRSLSVSVREHQYAAGLLPRPNLSNSETSMLMSYNGPLFPGSSWYVLSEGHIDAIDVAYEDEALDISIHDESVEPDVERDPAYTVLVVKSAAKVQVPDERFDFLGPVGATVWLLPESQTSAEVNGLLWPGIATAEIESGVLLNDQVDIRFRQVLGPNGVSLFFSPQDEFSEPSLLMDSEDGLPDTYTSAIGTHTHANWAFESPGVYLLTVQARGSLADLPGNPIVSSPDAMLKFIVLP